MAINSYRIEVVNKEQNQLLQKYNGCRCCFTIFVFIITGVTIPLRGAEMSDHA